MKNRRFNPPPSWPVPPNGWTPEPGWKPDPAWGPQPAGWKLWIDTRPWFQRKRFILPSAGVAFIVALGVAAGGGEDQVVAASSTSTSISADSAAATKAEQVRAATQEKAALAEEAEKARVAESEKAALAERARVAAQEKAALAEKARVAESEKAALAEQARVTAEKAQRVEAARIADEASRVNTSFGEGSFQVGVDVDPGVYRSSGAKKGLIELCSVSTETAAGDTVDWEVANANEQVLITIKEGQTVKNSGCEEFNKR